MIIYFNRKIRKCIIYKQQIKQNIKMFGGEYSDYFEMRNDHEDIEYLDAKSDYLHHRYLQSKYRPMKYETNQSQKVCDFNDTEDDTEDDTAPPGDEEYDMKEQEKKILINEISGLMIKDVRNEVNNYLRRKNKNFISEIKMIFRPYVKKGRLGDINREFRIRYDYENFISKLLIRIYEFKKE